MYTLLTGSHAPPPQLSFPARLIYLVAASAALAAAVVVIKVLRDHSRWSGCRPKMVRLQRSAHPHDQHAHHRPRDTGAQVIGWNFALCFCFCVFRVVLFARGEGCVHIVCCRLCNAFCVLHAIARLGLSALVLFACLHLDKFLRDQENSSLLFQACCTCSSSLTMA